MDEWVRYKIEINFFWVLLVISAIFFFQEYLYILIPNHQPFWIFGSFYGKPEGIPLTIVGIIGIAVFVVWYIFRGKKISKIYVLYLSDYTATGTFTINAKPPEEKNANN